MAGKLLFLLAWLPCAARATDYFYDGGRHRLCFEGRSSWSGEFTLAASVTAQVEIRRVSGAEREHKGEARFWIDGLLLGPLRREYDGATWTHPRKLSLSAGVHRLEVECGDEPIQIEGVRVWDAAAGAAAAPARDGATAATAQAGAITRTAGASPCGGELRANTQWRPGKPTRAIVLSVTGGKAAGTGKLAELEEGETLRWWFKVAPRPVGKKAAHPPVMLKYWKEGRLHRLQFTLDELKWNEALKLDPEGQDFPAFGYRRDKWTPLDLSLCPRGRFLYSLNEGEIQGEIEVKDRELPLEIQAKGLELSIKGAQ